MLVVVVWVAAAAALDDTLDVVENVWVAALWLDVTPLEVVSPVLDWLVVVVWLLASVVVCAVVACAVVACALVVCEVPVAALAACSGTIAAAVAIAGNRSLWRRLISIWSQMTRDLAQTFPGRAP